MRIVFYGNFRVSYSSETHHAATLELLGHDVIRLQEPSTPVPQIAEHALAADLFVWIHTHGWNTPGMDGLLERLREKRVPSITYHLDLWMGLRRQREMLRDAYWNIDHFFTVDQLMSDYLNANTPVRGHFIPAGVFEPECYISDQPSVHGNDVVFVGSRRYHPEWPWRPKLIDWLRNTYRSRFTHVGGDGDTGTLRGDALNRMYANSKVAIGDTLCMNFDYPYYASDRLFEAPGRGAMQIFPHIKGVDEWFTDGEHLRFFEFGDFDGLKTIIDHYLEHDAERERIRRAGHEHVRANHTYTDRWRSILNEVF